MATERSGSVSKLDRRAFLGLTGVGLASYFTLASELLVRLMRARQQAARAAPPPDLDDLAQAQDTVAQFHTQIDKQADQALAQGDDSFTVQIPPDQQTEINQSLQVIEAEAAYQKRRNELELAPLPLRIWVEGGVTGAAMLGVLSLLTRRVKSEINQSKSPTPGQ